MNYEAGSLYPHRALLEEAQFTVLLISGKTAMFGKLLVTILVRVTHEPDMYLGPFLRLSGTQLYIEKQDKKNPLQERE